MSELKKVRRRAAVRDEAAKKDHPEDFYPTPAWATRALLRTAVLPAGGVWLEPCAGHGALVEAVDQHHREQLFEGVKRWDLVELRPQAYHPLRACIEKRGLWTGGRAHLFVGEDYLTRAPPAQAYDVGITNPPFAIAERVVGKMLEECRLVVCLLEASFLGSKSRAAFNQTHPADVVYLSERPDFKGGGTSGQRDYAWFIWPSGAVPLQQKHGRIVVTSRVPDQQGKLL